MYDINGQQLKLFTPEEMEAMRKKRPPAQPIPEVKPIQPPHVIPQTDVNVNPYKPTPLTNEVKALLNL